MIAAERQRQIDAEDWTFGHDDGHRREELALAAAVYAIPPRLRDGTIIRLFWPWAKDWLKPTDSFGGDHAGTIFETPEWRADRIRTLTKAGALVAAEIDRLQRRNDGD